MSYGQRPHIHFEHLTTDNGLINNSVNVIHQDSRGFLWFGTQDGLNRYDGYKFETFTNDTTILGLSNATVDCIYEDKSGNLWIGTFGGLNLYNRRLGRIQHPGRDTIFGNHKILSSAINDIIQDNNGATWLATGWMGLAKYQDGKVLATYSLQGDKNFKLSSNTITALALDKDQQLWVGTTTGFACINTISGETEQFYMDGDPSTNSINSLKFIDEDLWIGTKTGLVRFNPKSKKFDYFIYDPLDPFGFFNRVSIQEMHPTKDGKLWLATQDRGILYFDISSGTYFQFSHESNCNLTSNETLCLEIDDAGSMWVGSHGSGINFSNYKTNMFTNWLNTGINENGLGTGAVSCFLEDKKGNFWVGVDGGGINKLDDRLQSFNHYGQSPSGNRLSSNNIVGMDQLQSNNIWMATFGGGITILNPESGEFSYLTRENSGLVSDQLSCITEDNSGKVWIGTAGNGVAWLHPKTKELITFSYNKESPNSISNDIITFVYEAQNNQIWIGTYGGLNLFLPEDSTFQRFSHADDQPKSISSNAVTCAHQDVRGKVWIGTGKGLNLFDPIKQEFTVFTKEDGLNSNIIYAIEEDEQKNLWISTDEGLCRFNASKNSFQQFDEKDGVQGKEFHINASYRNSKGILFFGGINGYTAVDPSTITHNPTVPRVHLTKLRIHHREMLALEKGSPLTKSIEETDTLFLDYTQSVLTFEFSALNYIIPEKNKYEYWLEGFEENWNTTHNIRTATYTNLDPGKYTLHIRASNNDGVWNDRGRTLFIFITPPFWMTWWFRTIAALSILSILYFAYQIRVRAITRQNKILEEKVSQRTLEIQQQKEHIEEQSSRILEQNTHMEENIEVGRMVQMAVLPTASVLQERFSSSFIMFLPKDVVSGDFYWFMRKGNRFYLAAADCTGHGVAGGFLSMIGYNHLTEIVNQHNEFDAGEILDELNTRVVFTLRQRSEGSKSQDGMDISLAIFEDNSNDVQYAGAVNPILLIRKDSDQIERLETDLKIIGSTLAKNQKPFDTHRCHLEDGDQLYFFSDGYSDQFGGPVGVKKMNKKRFESQIVLGKDLEPDQQQLQLHNFFHQWKGDVEQFDDILVIGIKFTSR